MMEEPKSKKNFGFIYFIKAGRFVKVGMSKRDVNKRLAEHQVSNPYKCTLLCSLETNHMVDSEKEAQMELKNYHHRGEWYRLTPKVKEYIKQIKKYNKLFPMKWITHNRNNPHNPIFNGEWESLKYEMLYGNK